MKIVELTNKLRLAITNEEQELLEKFLDDTAIPKGQLNEREQVIAHNLTVKDVLLRINTDGKIYYKKLIN